MRRNKGKKYEIKEMRRRRDRGRRESQNARRPRLQKPVLISFQLSSWLLSCPSKEQTSSLRFRLIFMFRGSLVILKKVFCLEQIKILKYIFMYGIYERSVEGCIKILMNCTAHFVQSNETRALSAQCTFFLHARAAECIVVGGWNSNGPDKQKLGGGCSMHFHYWLDFIFYFICSIVRSLAFTLCKSKHSCSGRLTKSLLFYQYRLVIIVIWKKY